jgi:hypothetical protein
MSLLQTIFCCFPGGQEGGITLSSGEDREKMRSDEDAANDIVNLLYTTEKAGNVLKAEIQRIMQAHGCIQANGIREYFAEVVFKTLEAAVRAGRIMGPVIKDAYNRAVEATKKIKEFVKENPALCSIIAIGIIALLLPWLLEALGFAVEGIIEGWHISTPLYATIC